MLEDAGALGRVIAGRYRLVAALGQGGMGAVYRAIQEPLGRSVAVKLLSHRTSTDATARERFSREARTLSRLSHPNVVVLHDFGEMDDGALFLVMEEVRGRSLRDVMTEGRALGHERTARLGWGVARGLAAAHAEGIVHADLKPENVMVVRPVGEPEQVKLLDFGLARLRSEQGATVTDAGMIVGTPRYISPEQIQGVRDEPKSDLYALGVMLFEMLTGAAPFDSPSAAMLLVQHMSESPKRPSEKGAQVSPSFDDLVLSLLQKSPASRPGSAAEVMERLAEELRQIGTFDGPSGPALRTPPPVVTAESGEMSWPPRIAGAPIGDVTLVFTDIQGSSRLWDRAPAVMRDALVEHDRIMRAALLAHGGYEVKTQGDAFMVAFSGEEAAIRFCIEAQQQLLDGAWSEDLLGGIL